MAGLDTPLDKRSSPAGHLRSLAGLDKIMARNRIGDRHPSAATATPVLQGNHTHLCVTITNTNPQPQPLSHPCHIPPRIRKILRRQRLRSHPATIVPPPPPVALADITQQR